jgi:hypothetical protein
MVCRRRRDDPHPVRSHSLFWILALQSVTVDGSAPVTITWQSTDAAGNAETVQSRQVRIDKGRPVPKAYAAAGRRGTRIRLRYSVSDRCDTARVSLSLSKGRKVAAKASVAAAKTGTAASWQLKLPRAKGVYTFKVVAVDAAGNACAKPATARVQVK